ncbi:Cyclin-B2-3, partial [Cucurbita argyrosperma subsp. sororia]
MGDSAGPMFVQHTEAMLDEIDRMKLEIEEVDEEGDLYTHYRAAEVSVCVPPNYMAQQVHINDRMRGFLVDRLIIEFLQETLMLNTVQFKLSVPTPYVFMKRFLKAAQSDREVRSSITRE